MKRIAVIIAIILFLVPNVINADENFIIKWSIGDINFGINFFKDKPKDNPYEREEDLNWDASFALGIIGVEHINTRIGLEFNPARWRTDHNWFNDYDNEGWNFFNLNLYWNIIDYEGIQFGPFNRINYLYLTDNGLDWSKITNTLGIRFGLISYNEKFHYNLRYFGVECGYKIQEGRSAFYLGLNTDPLAIGELFVRVLGEIFGSIFGL